MPSVTLERLSDEITGLMDQPAFAGIELRARRRRARRRTMTAVGAVVVAQLVGAMALGALPGGRGGGTVATPAPGANFLRWAGVGDANHLYALVADCPGCGSRLVGSDDGGRTWTVRQRSWDSEVGPPRVISGRTLMAPGVSMKPPIQHRPARVSTDGGRTWADLTAAATPVSRVPAGGWLDLDVPFGSEVLLDRRPDPPRVVDPASRRTSPLTVRPLKVSGIVDAPATAGLWVAGLDQNGRPALAVSRDAGATWTAHAFDVAEGRDGDMVNSYAMRVATRDGRTVDAVVGNGIANYGYRSTDGGATWRRTNGGAALPDWSLGVLTLPDGTHVLQQARDVGVRTLIEDTTGYIEADLGWPGPEVDIAPDGSFAAVDEQYLYVSTDGRLWTRIVPR